MKEYLFLFHSTVGVIQTRKALQAAGMTFRVSDIPRDLRGGCGLCIWLTCPPGEEIQWVIPSGIRNQFIVSRMVAGTALHITGFLRVKDSLRSLRILLDILLICLKGITVTKSISLSKRIFVIVILLSLWQCVLSSCNLAPVKAIMQHHFRITTPPLTAKKLQA